MRERGGKRDAPGPPSTTAYHRHGIASSSHSSRRSTLPRPAANHHYLSMGSFFAARRRVRGGTYRSSTLSRPAPPRRSRRDFRARPAVSDTPRRILPLICIFRRSAFFVTVESADLFSRGLVRSVRNGSVDFCPMQLHRKFANPRRFCIL